MYRCSLSEEGTLRHGGLERWSQTLPLRRRDAGHDMRDLRPGVNRIVSDRSKMACDGSNYCLVVSPSENKKPTVCGGAARKECPWGTELRDLTAGRERQRAI